MSSPKKLVVERLVAMNRAELLVTKELLNQLRNSCSNTGTASPARFLVDRLEMKLSRALEKWSERY